MALPGEPEHNLEPVNSNAVTNLRLSSFAGRI
jgi:hypothetical protein